ncbi:MAG: tetratricopeptide repeat protein, partial [Bacteroidota bacterium]
MRKALLSSPMWILGLGWILALGMVLQSQAQNDDLIFVDQRKAETSLAKAVEPAVLGEYAKATVRVMAVCRQYPDYAPAWMTLGELHLKLLEWGPAVKAFENSIRLHQRLSIKAYHGLAQAAMQVGDYESVLKHCVEVPTFRLASEGQLRDLAFWRKQAQWALEAMKHPEPFDLQVAPSALLGDGASYLPCLCRNGTQIVFTRRGTEGEDFYESQLIDSNWQQAHVLESPLNSDLDEGGCWLSPDGQM